MSEVQTPTVEDLETWKQVERAISATARELCAYGCMDAPPGSPGKAPVSCRACGASIDKSWRRDALASLRDRAAHQRAKGRA